MSPEQRRRQALLRMTLFGTLLTLAGHVFLGFEQSWAQVAAALAVAYTADILLESIDAWATRRPARFRNGLEGLFTYLLSSHLTGLSVALLLFPGQRLWPIAFATLAGIGSKYVFRVSTGRGSRHIFNPSNFGIALTLILFPSVGIAPPYQFTENIAGPLDWAVPAAVGCVGIFLNARFTRKIPMIFGWLCAFVLQAVVRSLVLGGPLAAGLMPMTGFAFLLYSLYMITDPATTPAEPRHQVAFGAAVAVAYGLLQILHVVFGLFFALALVSAGYGLISYISGLRAGRTVGVRDPALAVGEVRL